MPPKPTEFEEFCAKATIAILNGDAELLEGELEEFWRDRTHLDGPPDSDQIPTAADKEGSLEEFETRFDTVDEIDPFQLWFQTSSTEQILSARAPLRELADSWIAADCLFQRWNRMGDLERFMSRRRAYFWFDRRDRRLRLGFTLPNEAAASEYATWLFFNVLTGFYCTRIGRCGKCGKYCLALKSGRFYCDVRCSRLQSAQKATEIRRRRARAKKVRVIVKEAKELNKRTWPSQEKWKATLLQKSRREDHDIKSKFITQIVSRGEVPKPKLAGQGS